MADSKKYDGSQWEHSLRKQTTATEAVENPLYSDGTAITAYTIKGNTVQNGTPTPSNPVEVNGVGVRTENLFDISVLAYPYDIDINTGLPVYRPDSVIIRTVTTVPIDVTGLTEVTLTYSSTVSNTLFIYSIFNNDVLIERVANKSSGYTISLNGANKLYLCFYNSNNSVATDNLSDIMLNTGSTAKPFEPYGYKIPIPNGQQTTNIYLGSTQTVRQIKKLVFDGTESDWLEWNNLNLYRTNASRDYRSQTDGAICDSLPLVARGDLTTNTFCWSAGTIGEFIININNYNLADLKTYLNSNPITIWYVLATPETAAVNEPLMKIGDYADTLSNATAIPTTEGANSITVDTTVQPSEFTATWTGWHDAAVKEWDGSAWS